MTPSTHVNPASFRDPDAFVFHSEGNVYRQLNPPYQAAYEQLMGSGLYDSLIQSNLLLPHKEADITHAMKPPAFKVLQYPVLPHISYPYEWCFSQLKDAALVTLEIQKKSILHNMSLKDASAFNIQFYKGRAVFIDTSSFESYDEAKPWVAYRQFCQHFLAPLAVLHYCSLQLGQMSRVFLDGMPLDVACSLLPLRARLSLPLLVHLFLHSRSIAHYGDRAVPEKTKTSSLKFSRRAMLGMLDSLTSAIHSLHPKKEKTEWGDYYQATNYSDAATLHKKALVAEYLERVRPRTVCDLGANTGIYSRLASARNMLTLACDSDPLAVEANYCECKKERNSYITPLLIDVTNPSAAQGWANEERAGFVRRAQSDLVMMLALIHHLAISHNIPLASIARLAADIATHLIIEFVPKEDSQVQRLLRNRKDIFPDYRQDVLEQVFSDYFTLQEKRAVQGSARTLYLMVKK